MNLKFNQKIIITILAFLIVVSIVFVYWFFQKKSHSLDSPQLSRVIFKEKGISAADLFAVSKAEINQSAQVLSKLKILNSATSLLDGLSLNLNDRLNIPLAVVIENHPFARPQMAGLEEAKIVYEVLVEGGITRYLAVFDPIKVEKIGPVRSARPYLIHWAEEFGGAFTHIGGSGEALGYLRNSSRVLNVDENAGENIILRDLNYEAPHNAFTSTTALSKKIAAKDWQKQITESFFKFKLKEYPVSEPIKKITLDFSFPSYKVSWEYLEKENSYQRYLAGQKHGEVKAKNLIIQILPNQLIPNDEKERLDMPVLGQGKALFFVDGEEIQGSWKKSDYGAKTVFYDSIGEEMQFNKGKTWIEVIDFVSKVSIL